MEEEEIHAMQDIAYDLPEVEGQPPLIVHWFQMKKISKGWTTKSYYRELNRLDCPLRSNNGGFPPSERFKSLCYIKKHFGRSQIFSLVVNGHLMAPSIVYQVVIENCTASLAGNLVQCIQKCNNGKGLTHDIHYNYAWVEDIPFKLYRKWITSEYDIDTHAVT